MSVTLKGAEAHKKLLKAIKHKGRKIIDLEHKRAAEGMRKEIRSKMSGRVLNVRTNRLRSSVRIVEEGRLGQYRQSRKSYAVVSDVNYAEYHERGATRPGTAWVLPARPIWYPAQRRFDRRLRRRLKNQWAKLLRTAR
jgi:hypothetical protein